MKKTRKKSKRLKRKSHKRSQARPSATPKRTVRLPVLGLFLCIAIGAFYCVWTFNRTRKESKKVGLPTRSKEEPIHKSTPSTLSSEDDFTKVKNEEMALAQEVLKDFPNNGDAYVLVGALHSRHANSKKAIEFFEKSLEINPNRPDVYRNLGQIAQQKEEFDKAISLWRKALEIQPNAPSVCNDIAKALMDSGKYPEAIIELEDEIKRSPRSIQAHFQLAEAYLQQKEYGKARKYYEETIKLEPKHSHAYHGLITVYARLKQRDKAKEYQAIFKKLKTKQSHAYMGRQWDTLADLSSLRKSLVRTYLDSERLYRKSGNIAKSEELLNKAFELEPDNVLCLERLASLYFATNRAPEALEHFEKISQIDPNNPIYHLNIGKVSITLKLFEKAEKAFQKTIELSPNRSYGYCELARLYLRTNKKLPQAQKLAQQALTLEITADNYFLLGWASDVNGDRVRALEAMEQAIKLEPHNHKFRKIYERIKQRN